MPNITLAIEKKLIDESREYARKNNSSLNALIRRLLQQQVQNQSRDWLKEMFELMDKAEGNSQGRKWRRRDIYDV